MNSIIARKLMSGEQLLDEIFSRDEEDDVTMESSTESLGLEFQLTNKYNKLLPYADELNKEAMCLLAEIKGQLGRAVALRKLQPDCAFATLKLQWYMKLYSLRFTKEDHIIFIKLMYELLIIPDLEPSLLNMFGSTLIVLLRKTKLLTPSDLELPWRPLYDLKKRLMEVSISSADICRFPPRLPKVIQNVINAAKVYFPVSATQEILDELRPYICPMDPSTMPKTMDHFENLLPLQLPPNLHPSGFHLWFDELMTLWETSHNAATWQHSIMWLLAKLAHRNIGYIDWTPHIPLMFTRFIRCLNLPVYYKQTQGGKFHKIETQSMALWIVSILGNDSPGQFHLEKFLKTVETYFYQANIGPWVDKLKDLLSKLATQFVYRLNAERYPRVSWETPIPESHKLTDADVDAFVTSMVPVAMTAMFGQSSINATSTVFRQLATIRPNLVIPHVIERMFATLDSLTEPHKLTASMAAVTAVARPLIQGKRNVNTGYTYNEGPSRVIPLLMSSLPGIDGNDLVKSFATFRLISVYTTMVPVTDSSRASGDLEDDDRQICEETAQFEDFMLQFFERIFSLIESSTLEYVSHENQENNGKSKVESMVELALGSVCMRLLLRTSNDIYQSVLHKLRIFVTERVFETRVSGPLAASLCRSFSKVNGRETLKALLPGLAETILEFVEEGEVAKEENLDDRLLYALLLVANIVDTRGTDLLPHMETLMEILDKTLHLKSREGSKLASRILRTLLGSLSNMSVCCNFMYNGKDFNDPHYPYVLDWGQGADIDEMELHWYVPGEEEIAMIQKIFNRYMPMEIAKIKEYVATGNSISRQELLTSLNIIARIIDGCIAFLPVPEDDSKCIEHEITLIVGIKGEVTMPDGGNVREEMVKVLSELQEMMLKSSEDDTKSLKVLPTIWSVLLLGKYRHVDVHKRHSAAMRLFKVDLRDDLIKKKKHLDEYILERAELQHEMRVYSSFYSLRAFHKDIMLQLFNLATSTYADVRTSPQETLFMAFTYFPYSYKFFMPHLVEMLGRDPEEHHEAHKGLLYLLLGPRSSALVATRDWGFLRNLWPALVTSKPSEKMSVIRLKNSITDTVYRGFHNVAIKLNVPESCVEIAVELWDSSPRPSVPQPEDEEIQVGLEEMRQLERENIDNYEGLVEAIVSAIEDNCHWRQRAMGMKLLRELAHPERDYPPRVINYFLNALLHDSLEERKIAIPTVVTILRQLKREHKKILIESPRCPPSAPLGIRSDNLFLQYNHSTRPLSKEQWNESRYVHEPYIGFYTWPKQLEVYAPSGEQPPLGPERELSPSEHLVEAFVMDPSHISKLINFNSLEERKGRDKFNEFRFQLYKGLFRNHGVQLVDLFLPHLSSLVTQKQESSQLCAAEVIAGMIRGSKHWDFDMIVEMWEKVLPVIRIALENVTTETVRDWGVCFGQSLRRRDPNRHHWLLECLMEEPAQANATASFLECQRLFIVHSALINQTWRVSELCVRLLERVERRLLADPFQNVRDSLGSLLTLIFSADYEERSPDAERMRPRARDLMGRVLPQLVELSDVDSTDLEDRKTEISLLKTICKWIVNHAFTSDRGTLPDSTKLLTVLCQLENCEGDDELRATCRRALASLAQTQALPGVMEEVLGDVESVFGESSWSAKNSCLSFLEVFVFYNMGVILSCGEWVGRVQGVVLRMLEDERVEVREKAGQVLCGLLHCTFVPDPEALLEEFKLKSKIKIKKPDDLRLRHAGVLGLCAFVRAQPYHVPKYVPSIFEYLNLRLNDPQPIPTTIRKTLGDFKRTHYDGWASHAQSFTEEQLGILQDLTVPPSYYA
ncbi:proteasome activator complex subunit 4 [Diachasma alloeum]|uniref:proteasome activator complex subunit 4 n=1 Tax=Diachasma alloeum TaxID=454923 RepID=UPI0007383428|nr:proteasome activator complex subunit 4 [Diachasma alloeum]